jgi:hypothetical protein
MILKRICHLVLILLNFLILILNLFLFNYITKNDTKTKFKNGISDHFTLLKFYNIYCKSLDSGTYLINRLQNSDKRLLLDFTNDYGKKCLIFKMNLKIHLIIKCLPVDFKYINPESNSI